MVFTSDGSAPRRAGARDGITLPEPESRDSQLMVPGNRFEVLVQAPTDVGRFTLTGRTADGFGQPDIPFVTVEVSGDLLEMSLPSKLPDELKPIGDSEVTKKQTVNMKAFSAR